ncbi:MAG TPA: metal-dependent hydrolase [Candidatus Nanoarchaeia archaeon]|nr:metal-dependent hydrolase [Candidatus Nanoarchaeia archaeon]
MPFAVTHVLLTIILLDLYRDYFSKHKRYFTIHTLFIAGVAGLLPDIDIVLDWFIDAVKAPVIFLHGYITHTIIFGLIFLIPAFIFWKRGYHKRAMYFFVICYGVLFHILLDVVIGGGAKDGAMLLWPLSVEMFKVHALIRLQIPNLMISIDAIILLLWLYHEERKHKISDFI